MIKEGGAGLKRPVPPAPLYPYVGLCYVRRRYLTSLSFTLHYPTSMYHFNTEPFSYKGGGHYVRPLWSFVDRIWKVFLKFNITHGKSCSFFIWWFLFFPYWRHCQNWLAQKWVKKGYITEIGNPFLLMVSFFPVLTSLSKLMGTKMGLVLYDDLFTMYFHIKS